MAASTVFFVHKALDKTQKHIRLLKVLPSLYGLPHENVRLEVGIFDLETAPPFTAVSYEWGPIGGPTTILVEDKILGVRHNLGEFLHYFQPVETTHAYLWIDQICIDQRAVDERNHQVSLMSAIFSRADEVLVWLGPHSKAHHAFDAVQSAVEIAQKRAGARFAKQDARPPKTTIAYNALDTGELQRLYGNILE